MRKRPSATLSVSSLTCSVLLGLLAPGGAQTPAALPKAVTEKPPNPINGERPWAELQQDDIDNITAALPERAQTGPAKPRKLLVFYRTDGFPHASIPHWNKCIELLGQKTGAFTVTLSQSYGDLMPEKLREYDAVFVPCHIAYEKIVEATSYTKELGGAAKEKVRLSPGNALDSAGKVPFLSDSSWKPAAVIQVGSETRLSSEPSP
jgi:hypothetical protein